MTDPSDQYVSMGPIPIWQLTMTGAAEVTGAAVVTGTADGDGVGWGGCCSSTAGASGVLVTVVAEVSRCVLDLFSSDVVELLPHPTNTNTVAARTAPHRFMPNTPKNR
ncbi:hypothetical protein GS489_00910 [Rhodococcus hoagii]|nr:hypothetical protein [Prescottella equi]